MRIDPATETVDVVATAGDPLGVQIDADGRLVVADADLGLIAVHPTDGAVTVLADHVHGEPIMLADELAIADSGTVYFSEASTRFPNADVGPRPRPGLTLPQLVNLFGERRPPVTDRHCGHPVTTSDGLVPHPVRGLEPHPRDARDIRLTAIPFN